MENPSFGVFLKQERKKRSLTQKEFCKIIGVSSNTLINYENGHSEPSKKKQAEIRTAINLHSVMQEKTFAPYRMKDDYGDHQNSLPIDENGDLTLDTKRKARILFNMINDYFPNIKLCKLSSESETDLYCFVDIVSKEHGMPTTARDIFIDFSIAYDSISQLFYDVLFRMIGFSEEDIEFEKNIVLENN